MANADDTQELPPPANASRQHRPKADSTTRKHRRLARKIWPVTQQPTRKKPAAIKAERFVTVSQCPGETAFMPWIRLRGQWLEQVGFELQTKVRIQVRKGKLILTPEPRRASP